MSRRPDTSRRYPAPFARLARAPILAVALAAGLAGAEGADAQTILGRVLAHADGTPIPGAAIRLLGADDRAAASTITGDDGRFRIVAPSPGEWWVAAEHIGYGTARSDTLRLTEDQVLSVVIRLSVEPVPLEERFLVVGNVSHTNPQIAAFHQRRRQGERTGVGHFIYGDDLHHRGGRPTDLLRMVPGVNITRERNGPGQIIRMRGGCVPALYIDGNPVNQFNPNESLDTYVAVSSIEGIEIYRGSQQPGGPFFDRGGCGIVLVWTKRGGTDGEPITVRRVLVLLGVVALLFLIQ